MKWLINALISMEKNMENVEVTEKRKKEKKQCLMESAESKIK